MSKKMSTDEFIKKSNIIHNNRYDYSKVDMDNRDEKGRICIICRKHGSFMQMPYKHLQGQGCKKCASELDSIKKTRKTSDFIQKASVKHNGKYSYDNTEYNGNKFKIKITCPIHGDFEQTPDDHLQGKGCPICGSVASKAENEICSMLKDEEIIKNSKKILNSGKEIDIFIPSKMIGIEYNGLRWHSELYKENKNYHLEKLNECNEQGIKLIQIFEDEYIHHKDIVLNKILHLTKNNINLPKIMGRKCKIIKLDNYIAKSFLESYHIQGFSPSSVYLGAEYNNTLIGVMSFKKENKDGYWELTRFASDYHFICQGIGGKLFKHFIKEYKPTNIKSFADKRWTIDKNNNIYTKLGFILDKELYPDYRYYDPNRDKTQRFHKFSYRKQKLSKKFNFPLKMTENEMTTSIGCYKIWDCGLIRYVWKKKEGTN